MVEVGQKFRMRPEFSRGPLGTDSSQTGKVVYVHPEGRYAVLEFKGVHGKPREAFSLRDLLHKKNGREGK